MPDFENPILALRDEVARQEQLPIFTQTDLAMVLKVTKAAVSHWEQGGPIAVENAIAITRIFPAECKKLGFTVESLLTANRNFLRHRKIIG